MSLNDNSVKQALMEAIEKCVQALLAFEYEKHLVQEYEDQSQDHNYNDFLKAQEKK